MLCEAPYTSLIQFTRANPHELMTFHRPLSNLVALRIKFQHEFERGHKYSNHTLSHASSLLITLYGKGSKVLPHTL
jgi:hypothetical protein